MKTAYDIIIKPVITEQSMEATEGKKYVFQVAIDANKVEIKKAVEARRRSQASSPTKWARASV